MLISCGLAQIYEKNHKNLEYALNSLLDSLDPDSYEEAFSLIESIHIGQENVEIRLSDTILERIQEYFPNCTALDRLIEELLWVAVLFPRI